ncbi:MAG: DNA primase [Acidilobaceae archaeon]|nr:DNA primase [Acidilobaceae archaeon]
MYRRGQNSIEFKRWDRKILRSLFAAYYGLRRIRAPREVAKREFAFQPLEAESYVRHIHFPSAEALADYLVREPPKHAYYSVSLYLLPEARSMEEKGWLGSEILVDIDVDKLEECKAVKLEEGEILDDSCLKDGFRQAHRAKRILERDFGLEVIMYFSGSRGFHLVAYGEKYLRLGRDEREEIARYIAAKGLRPELLFPKASRKSRPAPPSSADPGWRGWIGEAGPEPGRAAKLGVPIDEQVTRDPSRLARILGSINGKSGLLVTEVGDSFSPNESLAPWRGELTIRAKVSFGGLRVLGESISLRAGESLSASAHIGLLLYLKGAAEILSGEVRVV